MRGWLGKDGLACRVQSAGLNKVGMEGGGEHVAAQ